MWALRAILIVALVLCVVAFVYYNPPSEQYIQVNLGWVQYSQLPLVTVVFWSFVPGVLVSLFVFMSVFLKQSVQLRATRRRIKALEGEVTVLRNRPIEESADLVASGESKPPADKPLFSDNE